MVQMANRPPKREKVTEDREETIQGQQIPNYVHIRKDNVY